MRSIGRGITVTALLLVLAGCAGQQPSTPSGYALHVADGLWKIPTENDVDACGPDGAMTVRQWANLPRLRLQKQLGRVDLVTEPFSPAQLAAAGYQAEIDLNPIEGASTLTIALASGDVVATADLRLTLSISRPDGSAPAPERITGHAALSRKFDNNCDVVAMAANNAIANALDQAVGALDGKVTGMLAGPAMPVPVPMPAPAPIAQPPAMLAAIAPAMPAPVTPPPVAQAPIPVVTVPMTPAPPAVAPVIVVPPSPVPVVSKHTAPVGQTSDDGIMTGGFIQP